jgi:hypothetical protein
VFAHQRQPRWFTDALNVRNLLEFHEMLGPAPLPRSLAQACLMTPKDQ